MPFGPTNGPNFYSAMMNNIKDEWRKLFIIRVRAQYYIDGEPVRFRESFKIFVGAHNIISGDKIFINDILLYCSNNLLIII